jgi:membrane protease YdiL (CAAX protease family)
MNNTTAQKGWRVFLGSFALLIVSYTIYFFRYPIWSWNILELIFTVLILSYLAVFVVALFLLKKDLKKPLSKIFQFHGVRLVLIGLVLALLFQALWYGITIALGTKLQILSFGLRGYELYSYYSLPLAFTLYAIFSVFGSLAEEVAYRGYVQTKISAKYGVVAGISVATIFFSLQHIHIFQLPWIESFFQVQFVNVLFFGITAGYFYFKSKGDIWSVFVFHAVGDLFNISLPIQMTYTFPYAYYISTAMSYVVLFLILRFLPLSRQRKRGYP